MWWVLIHQKPGFKIWVPSSQLNEKKNCIILIKSFSSKNVMRVISETHSIIIQQLQEFFYHGGTSPTKSLGRYLNPKIILYFGTSRGGGPSPSFYSRKVSFELLNIFVIPPFLKILYPPPLIMILSFHVFMIKTLIKRLEINLY